jgi:RecA/RadA recombinase
MNTATLAPFIGIRPYSRQESHWFFGRKRQLDDLLVLLQTQRIINLVGPAGSGKTSLIEAGLVPILEKGHPGISGRDWAICSFRPGISPIANLSHALTTPDLLFPGLSPASSDAHYFESIIRKSNKGIIDIYKNSDIAGKKNLLLIVDQFEDIFLHEELNSSEINIFIDNLLRPSKEVRTAIYVLFVLRSENAGGLFAYRRFQEQLTDGQYLLPRLRKTELGEIIEESFKFKGVSLDKSTLDYLTKEYVDLTHLQFLLFKAFEHNVSKIDAQLFRDLGGISNCLNQEFDQLYHEQNEPEKILLNKWFRAISNGENNYSISYERSAKLCECSIEDFQKVILPFNSNGRYWLDIIPPVISPIKPAFFNRHLIRLKYPQIFTNWPLFNQWTEKERQSKDELLNLVSGALKYESGSTGLLKQPDLDIALKWLSAENPSSVWAERYTADFPKAIQFLKSSEIAFQDEIAAKELAQKNKIKTIRKRFAVISSVALVVIVIVLGLYVDAQRANAEAQIQKKKALSAEEIAVKEAETAKNERIIAIQEKEKAKQAELVAIQEKEKAEEAQKLEQQAQLNLRKSLAEEQAAKKLAEVKKTEAEIANQKAAISLKQEEIAKNLANDREKLANNLKEFFIVESEINSEPVTNPQLIEKALALYANYRLNSEKVFGRYKPNNQLIKMLYAALGKSVNNIIMNTPGGGLRALVVLNNGSIATGGDDGKIYYTSSGNIIQIPVGERIRTLAPIQGNQLLVGTFNGSLFQVDPLLKSKKTLVQSKNPPNPSVFTGISNSSIYSVHAQSVQIIPLNGSSPSSVNLNEKIWTANLSFEGDRLIISTNKGLFFLEETKQLVPVPNYTPISTNPVTAITLYNNKLVLGHKSGLIKIYNYPSFSLYGELISHQSEITSLMFDADSKNLFSASLDKTVNIYDLSLEPTDIINNVVTIDKQKKWVWALGKITESKKHYLVTTDEDGFVYKWLYLAEDIVNDLKTNL